MRKGAFRGLPVRSGMTAFAGQQGRRDPGKVVAGAETKYHEFGPVPLSKVSFISQYNTVSSIVMLTI